MTATREIRITGGRDQLRGLVQQLLDQIDDSTTDDIEAEVTVAPNSRLDPTLLLNLTSTGCEDDDTPLVDYAEIGAGE